MILRVIFFVVFQQAMPVPINLGSLYVKVIQSSIDPDAFIFTDFYFTGGAF